MLYSKFRFRRTTIYMVGLASFLVGLGLARTKTIPSLGYGLVSLALCWLTFRRSSLFSLVSFIFLGLSFGWWRGGMYMRQLARYPALHHHKVTIIGRADSDAIYAENSQLSFDLAGLKVVNPLSEDLVGKISVKGFGEYAVYRGDIVKVEGSLYPTRGSKQAGVSFAAIEVLQRSGSPIELLRRKFQAGIFSALPEPLGSFGLGLLVGQRNTLPQEVNDQLSTVGLTHLVAVSGYNLTIIMSGVYLFLRQRSKYQSTVLSLALIGSFLLFAGNSASIIRAAIVSTLSIAAAYYGRQFRPLLLILLAAVITAGLYPLYIWSDLGWYLSFLAFYGVLVIGPLITERFYGDKKPPAVFALVIETVSAQIVTVPLIMYIFGRLSNISLLANLLVVPMAPMAMALSFAAGLGGTFVPHIAGWLAWPARIILTYMLDMVTMLSRVPHASSQSSLSLAGMLAGYAIIVLLTLILQGKNRPKVL